MGEGLNCKGPGCPFYGEDGSGLTEFNCSVARLVMKTEGTLPPERDCANDPDNRDAVADVLDLDPAALVPAHAQ